MNDNCVVKNNNVVLVDPNCVNNIDTGIPNSIPQYENMHIFADLTATRKGRTVLISGSGVDTDETVTVNMMGFNQNKENPNYGKFTTNYYDGSTNENETQYESFGIKDIKVTINSSFIPQISIEFIDIRGLSFFNQEDSPYRILFDFPPPTFRLSIKGYYGKILSYRLHLLKYTTNFNSDNGNFYINADFVAMTFAPLTDVLFRYVINFPLMINNEISVDINEPPKNTFEFIQKVKNLFTNAQRFLDVSEEQEDYDSSIKKISEYRNFINFIENSKNSEKLKELGYEPKYFISESVVRSDDEGITIPLDEKKTVIEEINRLSKFDKIISEQETTGTPITSYKRLLIGYSVGSIDRKEDLDRFGTLAAHQAIRSGKFIETLNEYKDRIEINSSKIIGVGKINSKPQKARDIETNWDVNGVYHTDKIFRYIYIDITDFYCELMKKFSQLRIEKSEAIGSLNELINNMIKEELGMIPTIYNVFKLILDDVDKFFNILRKVSELAEKEHHNRDDIKARILSWGYGDYREADDEETKIYSFPLFIDREIKCNAELEKRVAPIDLSNSLNESLGEPFPELVLVDDFINTFLKQSHITRLYNMRGDLNPDGSFIWIPISPFDSILYREAELKSPYIGIDNTGGAGNISLSENDKLTQIFKRLIPRFYVLTQYIYPETFKNLDDVDGLMNYYARSEAINLSESLTNTELRDMLFNFSRKHRNNIEDFNQYLNTNLNNFYEDTGDSVDYIKLSSVDHYVNKNDNNYVGCSLISGDINLNDNLNISNSNPVNDFLEGIKPNWWQRQFSSNIDPKNQFGYLSENVFFINDGDKDGGGTYNNLVYESRFINSLPILPFTKNGFHNTIDNVRKKIIEDIKEIDNNYRYNGNAILDELKDLQTHRSYNPKKAKSLNLFGNVINIWVGELGNNDKKIYDKVINFNGDDFDKDLSALLILSNFGNTLSPFNQYPHLLNERLFKYPAAINVPKFLPAYIGALVDIDEDDYNNIYDFFVNNEGNTIRSSGLFIFADIVDIKQKLSKNEKNLFKREYNRFINNDYDRIIRRLKHLYDDVNNNDINTREKVDKYSENLNVDGVYFEAIFNELLKSTYILNFSELTFDYNDKTKEEYISINNLENINENAVQSYNKFFKEFFNELMKLLNKKNNEEDKQEELSRKLTGDRDIITQTYYSFKNINDKWLVNPMNGIVKNFPFNDESDKLINLFAFVDRGMNPVGDTIINPEILINLMEDPNISVFSVLSQILSTNGFEFFPLQNFMNIEYDGNNNDGWSESFEIDTTGTVSSSPNFVCMYIGGSSNYPTGIRKNRQFEDDGILKMEFPDIGHFSTSGNECQTVPDNDNQLEGNKNFPWSQVRAFRVRFAEQNQSMFTNYKINSKDFPETNESIQILSRLAGDNKINAPVPKGQNLYNLYENRAYSATIDGLGNAMIQPTQYFQLENIPLFNGAYLITDVEHHIEANKMLTTFTGTKILKYPIPRVTEPASILGFDGGDTSDTNEGYSSEDDVLIGVGAAGNPEQAKYNSMYTQKIK